MKKIFGILLTLALVLSFSLVVVPAAPVFANGGTDYYVSTSGNNTDTGLDWAHAWLDIQFAVSTVSAGDTINVAAGTYVETGQIVINKNLTITGANKQTTIIKPAQNTGGSGDARGWFLVQDGKQFNLSNVTLDGTGKNIYQAIRSYGSGTIDNNIIKNIDYSQYIGWGMVVMGNYDMTFSNNTFTNIERIGMMAFGSGVTNAQINGNTYTGKGAIDCLDYGIEIGGGATATITGNTITNCKGVASSDGSTSAGILVTTYYGAGTTATITGNTLTGNTGGVAVGYDESDTSTVVAHGNSIAGNTDFGIDTTAPAVDATGNWWGDASGPYHATTNPSATGDSVSDNVDYSPWWGADYISVAHPWQWYTNDSVQDAIDDASASDTVNVVVGTYDESVTINKNNLTLSGQIGSMPAITGGLKLDNISGFTLENFEVTGTVDAGKNSLVRMYDVITDLTVDNCVFDGENTAGRNGFSGGQIEGDLSVTDSEFKDIVSWSVLDTRSGSGGDGSAMGTVTFANNDVHDCDGSIVFRGLSTDWTDNVYIYGNTFQNIGEEGVSDHWAAFEVNRATNVEIYGNEIRNVVECSWGEGQAMQLWKVDTVDIHDNTVEDNYMGITFLKWPSGETYDISNISIYSNYFSGNDQYALSVENGLTGGLVDAENNCWGAASGPGGVGSGTGDAVSSNVDFEPWYPAVTTQAASSILPYLATLNMNYAVGCCDPVEVQFAYKKSSDTGWSYTGWETKSGSGSYAEAVGPLAASTQYDFKAQLKYGDTIEGTTLQFTTGEAPPIEPPSGPPCFIATAAYGTPSAEQIDVLREFRDVVLMESTVGSQLVDLYYQLSPPVADFIAGNEVLRTLVRELLVDPIVCIVEATGDIWRN